MELRQWTYEEFPAFSEEVEGAKILPTDGDEWIVSYTPNVEYADANGHRLVLQILQPHSRNNPEPILPCVVFVQGFIERCFKEK